jgi:hypothetical protein
MIEPSDFVPSVAALIAAGLGAYLGSWFKRKGEIDAEFRDLDKLIKQQGAITEAVESIKASISDDAWDRQEQWKLRRDVVIDLIRAMADMDRLIPDFSAAFSSPSGILTEEAKQHLMSNRIETFREERRCTSEYLRAHTVADLAIHGKLSRASSSYFQFAGRVLKEIPSNPGRYDSKTRLELAKLHNAAIIAARKELGVYETDDLPVLDYENLPSGDDVSH